MSGAAIAMAQVKLHGRVKLRERERISLCELPQGCERDAVFLEAEEDSQNESEEWGRGFEEWERGEGSGESENESPPVGASDEEEGNGGFDEEEDEEGEGEERDTTQVALGDHSEVVDENTVVVEPGVRDISENDRGTPCERELLVQRVGQLPPPPSSHPHCPTPHTLTPVTPTTPVIYYSSSGRRQWLLELALVLLITTLLVTVCSKLSYEWLVGLYTIVPEKPM